ncbi:alkaline-phosphatase-like protein [Penicillium hordei]|uniref:Alkaline-phosphatase-like protein n=1 Tax=Penicillium hordei TaxID=40994 RepID=A0AAD6DL87_9EURO|nr:alkaline-phosphatase-like protein [Penicillium hordei]KAJ5588276.1 alkaline-phosphatase-like protein [Penicillium hordei]
MSQTQASRPNFLIIVADDLGYSDTGPFGSEIETPVLDRLASSGVRLTNFHTASACSPTRSMLFSGTDNHIAGLGQMAEFMKDNRYDGKPGYEGYLNFRVAALSEVLQDAGYSTFMSGKWHLGLTKETAPCSRGFDEAYAFLYGCGNHFNHEPQLDDPAADQFGPMSSGNFWMEGDRFLDRQCDIPDDFYSSTSFADKLVEYLDNRTDRAKPWLAYLPFTAPHWPLHAPRQVIEKYKGFYDEGPHMLREKRLKRLVELGIILENVEPAEMTAGAKHEWEQMNAEERATSARKMEVYAAMVDVIDQSIGRVVDHLDKTGELDNTFILFMSDNGAEGSKLEAVPLMGGETTMGKVIEKYYNNSFDNIGMRDSYVWYGPAWACASMAPSRGFKSWITEGGIRCPCIVRFPPAVSPTLSQTDSFCTVMDIMPTILDLSGVPSPSSPFHGRDIVPMRGSSWVPHLSGRTASFHDEEKKITGWELFGLRAIREGPWKAIYMNAPRGSDDWELYNVTRDPGEIHDVAMTEPEILKRLIKHWEVYYAETGMFDPGQDFRMVKHI